MAKGSRPRPYSVPLKQFDNQWDTIFGKKDADVQVRVKEDTRQIGNCGCGRSPTGKCVGWHGLTDAEFNQRLEDYQTGKADLNGIAIK